MVPGNRCHSGRRRTAVTATITLVVAVFRGYGMLPALFVSWGHAVMANVRGRLLAMGRIAVVNREGVGSTRRRDVPRRGQGQQNPDRAHGSGSEDQPSASNCSRAVSSRAAAFASS